MRFTMKQAADYRGLTNDDISKSLGVSKTTISSYMTMKAVPRYDLCLKFSYLVDIPLKDLIFFKKQLDLESSLAASK